MPNKYTERSVLEQASTSGLPEMVSDGTIGPISVVRELFNAGLLTGHPIQVESENKHFQFLAITSKGRERLHDLRERENKNKFTTKATEHGSRFMWIVVASLIGVVIKFLFDYLTQKRT